MWPPKFWAAIALLLIVMQVCGCTEPDPQSVTANRPADTPASRITEPANEPHETSRDTARSDDVEIPSSQPVKERAEPTDPPDATDDRPLPEEQDETIAAIAALKELGVRVEREGFGADSPVVAVSLFGFRRNADAALAHVAKIKTLRKIDLSQSDVTDGGLPRLSGLTNLEVLKLHSTAVSDDGLARLGGLSNLMILDLGLTKVTDVGLLYLHQAPLEELHLFGAQVSGEQWEQWKARDTLEVLDIRMTQFDDAELGRLHSLEKLRLLEVGDEVTDAGLAQLAGLFKLEKLVVFGPMTDAGLRHLGTMTTLKDLRLGGNHRISDDGVAHLRQLKDLEELWLASSEITDDGLSHVGQMARLRKLYLTQTKVGDAGVARLTSLTDLEVLDLQSTKITDASIDHLRKLKNLERLYIQSTGVTEAGIDRLQQALPQCAIWD